VHHRRALTAIPSVLALSLLLAACGSASGPTDVPDSLPPAVESTPADTPTAEPSEEPPTETPTEAPAGQTPGTSPEPPDASSSPAESSDPGSAAACTGTDANRDFYASVAAAVDWAVYCAVLPAGWFVDSGEYRLAGGGRMEIAYRGPTDARFELHEGAFCGDAAGCIPSGSEAGETPFGDRTGTLISADDGSWAVSVDDPEAIDWLAVGRGIDEATIRAFAADLLIVSD
jgi:hypothetical protein